jgi:hypothetical protein
MKKILCTGVMMVLTGLCADGAEVVNPWVTSDASPYGQPIPNVWSVESLHADPAFAGLTPKAFCRRLFDVYYDGRRKNWEDYEAGLTLWSHSPQQPLINDGLLELDPVLLLNVHGSSTCGMQSGLLEGIYQSRPGGTPGKPAIEARRWFLDGIVHSVCDAFYDGRWHYYDIDLGGYAGDAERDVWSVADVIADPAGYFGGNTSFKSPYFFKADGNGSWVRKISAKRSYAFQDNHMLGHTMSFALRPGETFTRYFSAKAAGWSEFAPPTQEPAAIGRGFCELVYAPKEAARAASAALARDGNATIHAVRCPYNITSSRVTATGSLSYSTDLGRTWKPVAADGLVAGAVNRWDYLLRIENGSLTRIVTRGVLHPGALPRVGAGPTTMTVASMDNEETLTWIPDWSSAEAMAATARPEGLAWQAQPDVSFSGGALAGSGSVTIPVKAPAGCRIVRLSVCAIGGTGSRPDADKWIELHLGPAGAATLAGRTTDCSPWGLDPATRVDHWQNNVNGSASFPPCAEAEVKLVCHGWAELRGLRIFAGYVREKPSPASGTLKITHGYDGKTFVREIPAADLAKGAKRTYTVPEGAVVNEFVRMEVL